MPAPNKILVLMTNKILRSEKAKTLIRLLYDWIVGFHAVKMRSGHSRLSLLLLMPGLDYKILCWHHWKKLISNPQRPLEVYLDDQKPKKS
jgi:hypothetical protein